RSAIQAIQEEEELPLSEFSADLYEPKLKDSKWGAPIKAPEFLHTRIKNGLEVETLTRIISAGVGGTAMPTWAGSLEPEQLWGIAYYVRFIALLRGTAEGRKLAAERRGGPEPKPIPAAPANDNNEEETP